MKKNIFLVFLFFAIVLAILIGTVNSKDIARSKKLNTSKEIAVIRVEGLIIGGKQDAVFGGVASSESIMKHLRDAAENPQTAAILLRINTPGGSAPAAQEIGQEIKKIKEKYSIPIVASMGDVAASGGYWIACCADKIIANPSTMTGSIGVIMETQSWSELYSKIGINNSNIKSGPHKDMGSTTRELTKEELQILQSMVNDIYEQFVEVVSSGRNLPPEKVREVADGRIFTGRQAKDLKLVDELGNYYDSLKIVQEAAGIEGEANVKEYGQALPWDIFKTQIQASKEQAALLKFASELLLATGVQR